MVFSVGSTNKREIIIFCFCLRLTVQRLRIRHYYCCITIIHKTYIIITIIMIICTYKSRFNDGNSFFTCARLSVDVCFLCTRSFSESPRAKTNPQPQWMLFICTNIAIVVVVLLCSISNATGTNSIFS